MIVSLFSSGGGGTYDVKLGVALPTVDDTGLVYDGTSKEPTIGSYSTELMTVTYTAQTNAGTYQVHCSLNDPDHYAWLNTIQSTDQDIPWTIARATGAISVSPNAVEVGEEETKTVTVTTSESTTVSALSSDTSVATVSISGNIVSITDGGSEGTATITVSAADSTNYTYGTATVSVVVQYLTIVTWGGGTDEQIVKMCQASDQGKCNLWDCWNIGDERTVNLSAMAATGVGESHRAQNVVMVIVHKRGYDISNSSNISAFIIQQKDCLSSIDAGTDRDSELGYMNSTDIITGSWNSCARRTWCNNVYRMAIPNTLTSIFKQVKVATATEYNASTVTQSNDYFFLPAAAEVYKGDSTYGTGGSAGDYTTAGSNLTEFNVLSRWKYYETAGNRVKKIGTSGAAYFWWERSPYYKIDNTGFCYTTKYGVPYGGSHYPTISRGIAPAACIGTANDGTVVIPTWADGTDAQIVAAVASADAGNINLADYWNVGDKRTVALSAMSATEVGESHDTQSATMVLVDTNSIITNGYQISGGGYPSFIVQLENCLNEKGYMNSTDTNQNGYGFSARHFWMMDVYKNAIPNTISLIFKNVNIRYIDSYNAQMFSETYSKFFLPTVKEIVGGSQQTTAGSDTTGYSDLYEFNNMSQWKYYETVDYRKKKADGLLVNWWTRSRFYGSSSTSFCCISVDGIGIVNGASKNMGIAPCGCI